MMVEIDVAITTNIQLEIDMVELFDSGQSLDDFIATRHLMNLGLEVDEMDYLKIAVVESPEDAS